ncbi:MAG: sulfatase family protein [Actinomadura sp.]
MSTRVEIDRRRFLSGSVTAAAAMAAPLLVPTRASADRPHPNVLVVITDDQPLGTDWAMPRTVGWLAGRGVDLANGFATTPLCAPSRASIFTGQYAHNHGVRSNGHSANLDHDATVQRYLRQAGYRTGLYGKFLNGWDVQDAPPYFDEWGVLGRPTYERGIWNLDGAVRAIPGYTTDVVRHEALGFLRRRAADHRPWLLYLTPYAPHAPNTPDAAYADSPVPAWPGRPSLVETDKSDKPPYIQAAHATVAAGERVRAAQLRTLRSVDDLVAAVHDQLLRMGQLDHTLVFFIGDNGFAWSDHGWHRKSVPYSPVIRVPFRFSWPAAGLNTGRVDERLAANIDIAPTILQAAGLRPDGRHPMDGHSLLTPHRRDHLLTEFWKPGRKKPGPPTWASLVTPAAQYTEYYDTHLDRSGSPVGSGEVAFREYYDLAADPYQLDNLLRPAGPRPDLPIGELAGRLALDRRSAGTTAAPVPGRPPAP